MQRLSGTAKVILITQQSSYKHQTYSLTPSTWSWVFTQTGRSVTSTM